MVVAVSTGKIKKLTILNEKDLTNEFVPNKFLRVKKPKWILLRRMKLYVTDVDVKNIGHVPAVLFHICVSYMKRPQEAKLKK